MNSAQEKSLFATRLLQQDEPVSDSTYKEYRMKLENALIAAERRERLAGRVVAASCVIGFALMFVGGSRILGDFDPWSKDATAISITLGVIYAVAVVVFPISLASYYSRFRPKVRNVREQLRDASMLALQAEVLELRKQVAMISRHEISG
jgi:TRAP-type C4-dicarboxylate transport system permease small subunit